MKKFAVVIKNLGPVRAALRGLPISLNVEFLQAGQSLTGTRGEFSAVYIDSAVRQDKKFEEWFLKCVMVRATEACTVIGKKS